MTKGFLLCLIISTVLFFTSCQKKCDKYKADYNLGYEFAHDAAVKGEKSSSCGAILKSFELLGIPYAGNKDCFCQGLDDAHGGKMSKYQTK